MRKLKTQMLKEMDLLKEKMAIQKNQLNEQEKKF